jgi:hypothetical protein
MPRVIHKPVFGIVQHVISRFVNGQLIMNRDDMRYKYLTRLGAVLTDTDGLLLLMVLLLKSAFRPTPISNRHRSKPIDFQFSEVLPENLLQKFSGKTSRKLSLAGGSVK